MLQISNGIYTVNRGDTFSLLIELNIGSSITPEYYDFQTSDKLYLGLIEPGKCFENAIVKKIGTYINYTASTHVVTFTFSSEDTEYLLPGTYYLEAKLLSANESGDASIYTILAKKKFILLD